MIDSPDSIQRRSSPLLLDLTHANRALIDRYAITALLSKDLYGVKYVSRPSPTPHAPYERKKRQLLAKTRPRKTLDDLVSGNVVSADYRLGFDDGAGNIVYVIERILRYEPDQGFLVHWKHCPKSQRSFVRLENIPESCMALAESVMNRDETRRKKNLDRNSDGVSI